MKTKYRVKELKDTWYVVQCKRWWFPVWITITDMQNMHADPADAELYLREKRWRY